jgi:hypothetical protein
VGASACPLLRGVLCRAAPLRLILSADLGNQPQIQNLPVRRGCRSSGEELLPLSRDPTRALGNSLDVLVREPPRDGLEGVDHSHDETRAPPRHSARVVLRGPGAALAKTARTNAVSIRIILPPPIFAKRTLPSAASLTPSTTSALPFD